LQKGELSLVEHSVGKNRFWSSF